MINLCNLCHNDIFIINKINIEEFDKIFSFYYINCEIEILFDNNYTANIEINYHYNTDYIKIKNYLLLYINISQLAGNKINNINNNDYAKNPKLINLIDRNENDPLIRKYFHIPFNN